MMSETSTQDIVAENPSVTLVKRYANRKLYDTKRSCYVTLDKLAQMVQAGEEIQIIDNESKADLTAITLTQIIHEQEKREQRMPLNVLRVLIQNSGNLQEVWEERVVTPISEAQSSVEKGVQELRHSAQSLRETATRSVMQFSGAALRIFSKEEQRAVEFRRNVLDPVERLNDRIKRRTEKLRSYLGDPASDVSRRRNRQVRDHAQQFRSRLLGLLKKLDELDLLLNQLEDQDRKDDF